VTDASAQNGRNPAQRVYRLMQQALDELPPQYASRLENVDIGVARSPTPRERRRLGLANATLYGLYEGVPLTHRGSNYDRVLPDRITLFWGPLLRDFPDEAMLGDEVRKTLYHEIAHYFGMNEDDLHQTSVR
jgi:predicted Zn-dependent protease with MMP-like domain